MKFSIIPIFCYLILINLDGVYSKKKDRTGILPRSLRPRSFSIKGTPTNGCTDIDAQTFMQENGYENFFPDPVNFPPENYILKYINKKGKTSAVIGCNRLKKKSASEADKQALKMFKKVVKKGKSGRLVCNAANGTWKIKLPIPSCPDRNTKNAWAKHFYINNFSFKGKENNKCLEDSQEKSMAAYDPRSGIEGSFPVAVWSKCDSESVRQKFKFLLTGQIVGSSGMCLTPLPISVGTHFGG